MMSWSVIATAAFVFVVGVTCSPIDITPPATELLPPKEDSTYQWARDTNDESSSPAPLIPTPATDLLPPNYDVLPTLSTDLQPPNIDSVATYDTTGVVSAHADDVPVPSSDLLPPLPRALPTDLLPPPLPNNIDEHKRAPATLYLINVFAVRNHTADDTNDVLQPDVMKEVPTEASEPLAMFLLVVEDDNETSPVSLDEVAKDLEAEGFNVEKIEKDGETRLIKVDMSSIMEKNDEDTRSNMIERVERDLAGQKPDTDDAGDEGLDNSGRLMRFRRKRSACLHCLIDKIKQKKYRGGGCGGQGCGDGCGGGGCGGGGGCSSGNCGGGGGYYPPPNYVPQPLPPPPVYYPPPPPVYHPPPQPPQQCNICQNGGNYGHRGQGGGGNSFASAHAEASASSYGK